MNKFLSIAVGIGEFLQLLWETLKSIKYFSSSSDKFLFQVFDMGNRTLPVAALISLSIGSVLALLTGIQLSGYGIEDKIGGIVGISLCTELAPVMAAILMAGRVGSSITAEISSMNIYEEISALKTMKIDPVRYLVLPRFLACLVTLPFLVIYMDLIGWLGGSFISSMNQSISVSFSSFYNDLSQVVKVSDIAVGLIKSIFFAITISIASCSIGLLAKGGPREIGSSVTKSVVASFISILILDYFLTRLLILVGLL
ncbi:MAG: MlaE family ABC transporter permease [Thermodesulfobacteriota bacterium]|jgi:phospholipid/cholesterol/gamma-HCH transport system permease protein|nr:ABC transporter permease [bacterium]MBT3849857.1 ABC transporter permease [bacterium]MBT4634304.1 ABC transporter permease [bacterium]|tara:strand:- start:3619 stop:4386 length:768 start_codon:yes stop_codon:yes gene_type:complete